MGDARGKLRTTRPRAFIRRARCHAAGGGAHADSPNDVKVHSGIETESIRRGGVIGVTGVFGQLAEATGSEKESLRGRVYVL